MKPGTRVLVRDLDVVAEVTERLPGGRLRLVTTSTYDAGRELVRRRRDLEIA